MVNFWDVLGGSSQDLDTWLITMASIIEVLPSRVSHKWLALAPSPTTSPESGWVPSLSPSPDFPKRPRDWARRQPPKHSASVVLKDDTSTHRTGFVSELLVGDITKRRLSCSICLCLCINMYKKIDVSIYMGARCTFLVPPPPHPHGMVPPVPHSTGSNSSSASTSTT